MAQFASDTSGRSAADWAKALVILLIGLTVAHLGVTLFLQSALGTDTFTVFIQGLSRVFGLTVGTVHVIVLCILMVVMLATTKGYSVQVGILYLIGLFGDSYYGLTEGIPLLKKLYGYLF